MKADQGMAPKAKGSKKQQDSKKGRPSGAGRRKGKFEVFHAHMAEKKARNVLKRNGVEAARAHVEAGYILSATLHKISRESTKAGRAAQMVFQG